MTRKVIITGAGSGIGKEFTKLYVADGSEVLAVSLLDDELRTLATELDPKYRSINTLALDLALPDSAAELFRWCTDNDWLLDVLINNAGFACFGDAVDLATDRVVKMLQLNVQTLTLTSMMFGKLMKQRGHGTILNVGSTAGMVPSTRMAAYCASKSYVNAFTYALAAELKPYGVRVTCLTPGMTQTNFTRASGIDTYSGKSFLQNTFARGRATSAAEVAEAGYHALANGKRQARVGRGSLFAALASRMLTQRRLPSLIKNP
ncbi:MAG: SDR family NAD(P)-dependent oxidoreductase [Mycobacterium sp.]|nr:SDR family NAD(P)-dependent oxidoreductase [Mycobacterium sp.]